MEDKLSGDEKAEETADSSEDKDPDELSEQNQDERDIKDGSAKEQ